MSIHGDQLLMARHTGVFLSELAERLGSLHLMQYALDQQDLSDLGGLCELDLGNHPHLTARCIQYRVQHPLLKHLDRLTIYSAIWADMRHRQWAYFFLPGRLPAYGAYLCLRRGIPYGVYVRGIVNLENRWTRRILAGAKVVICNNGFQAHQLQSLASRVEIAAPMMDIGPKDMQSPRGIRRDGPLTLLFVGRASQEKGLPELLQAMEALVAEGLDLHLVVVGSGPLSDPGLLPAALRQRVRMAGFIADKALLAQEYQQADIFVLPSHTEGFPRVLYEAMTFALPVVTTFVGGVRSIMKPDANCLEMKVGDATGLAELLRSLFDRPSLCRDLSQASLETMRAFYGSGIQSHADQVLRIMGKRDE
jgi:glycosyltransferase involved in cell wall biosynthesis